MVVGTSGAGKTTFATQFARRTGCKRIELDAINWQAGWHGLQTHDPDEFKRRTAQAAAAEAWVCDGNYTLVRPFVLPRATHLVWLDFARPLIMRRVIWRSFSRAITQRELYNGNRENALHWLDKDHPIRWAWDTFHRRRAEYEALFATPAYAHLTVFRLRAPREVADVLARLVSEAQST
jgi:adenylate kinase family enzyme